MTNIKHNNNHSKNNQTSQTNRNKQRDQQTNHRSYQMVRQFGSDSKLLKKAQLIPKKDLVDLHFKLILFMRSLFAKYANQAKSDPKNKDCDFIVWNMQKKTFFFPLPAERKCKDNEIKDEVFKMVKEMSLKPGWRLRGIKKNKRYLIGVYEYYSEIKRLRNLRFSLLLPAVFLAVIVTRVLGFPLNYFPVILGLFVIFYLPLFGYVQWRMRSSLWKCEPKLRQFLDERRGQFVATISKFNKRYFHERGYHLQVGEYGSYIILRKMGKEEVFDDESYQTGGGESGVMYGGTGGGRSYQSGDGYSAMTDRSAGTGGASFVFRGSVVDSDRTSYMQSVDVSSQFGTMSLEGGEESLRVKNNSVISEV